jgi:hypothetical protein
MNREEHVTWCKARAMEYYNLGDMKNAVTSMISDMNKREDTRVADVLIQLGMLHLANHNDREIKHWIEGFR